jgi:uncharacterized membrane protein YdfJ with MMPL/SSD domain
VSTPTTALTRNVILSAATLLSSAGTLVCCVLPAVLVALGAGAALAGLVTAVPQLVWLSEHKPLVFGIAFALLIASGAATWYSRTLPCPTEPVAAQSCRRLRRINVALYSIALVGFALGLTFAFILPRLT